jgi:hypothetical protein
MYNLIQERVRNFQHEILPFKNFIANAQVKAFTEMNEHFTDAVCTLGVGELYARKFERESQLKSLENDAKASKALFLKYNQLGLQRVADTSQKLKEAFKEVGARFGKHDLKSSLPRISAQIEEFKFQCVNLEIKGRDVEKLFSAMDSVLSSIQKGGLKGIIDFMDGKLTELSNLRQSEHRGVLDNFPPWKVAIFAVAMGIWVLGFIHCSFFRCTAASYFLIASIHAVVGAFC